MKFMIKLPIKSLCHFLSFIALVLWITILCCAKISFSANPRDCWPTHDWKTSLPEEQGFDSDKLYSVDDEIQAKFPDVYSLLIIKNGRLVFEDYYSFGEQEKIAPVHSVTKSVISILIGIAIDQGRITSVDQKVSEFFPEFFTKDINPLKKDISIRHLLTMTPGFEWSDRGEILWEWFFSSDFIKFTLDLDLESPPGEKFTYSSAVSHILSGILTRATGMTALEFGRKYLFNPLGIEDVKWTQSPKGFNRGGSSLQLKARDMAKIGFLYLNNGIWENKPIVSETWVKKSTKFQVKADFGYGYGYQWWIKDVNGCPSYRAWGRGGQFIVVIPNLDIVIVVTSKFEFPLPPTLHYSPLFEHIAQAVKENKCFKTIESKNISDTITDADNSDHCKHLVDVPVGVSTFLDGYAKAFKDKDIEKSMTFYSDAFLLDGRDKEGSRKMLSSIFNQIPINSICIQLSQFSQKGSIADVAGTMHLNSRASKLIVPKIIEENGQWKWYGGQRSKTDSPVTVPLDITRFLEGYSEAIVSHDKTKMAEYFSDHFSSRGFTKETFLSYAASIYIDITSVEIELTNYEQKEGSIYVDGLFKTRPFGTTPLMFNHIILEDGKWKWAGTVSTPFLVDQQKN
jgi:CubicO group peptidase (beta-lactamase class C family)